MSDPACRRFRELLGVYVVGAIEPSERSLLDDHLNQCYGCREELAGLAVLPALLHRIPVSEAEQFIEPSPDAVDPDNPAPRVLSRLLVEVRARQRSRRLRTVLAAAAAVVIAASGSVAVSSVLDHRSHPAVAVDRVFAKSGPFSGEVKYVGVGSGTKIWVNVKGVPEKTFCMFYVTTNDGRTELVGGWLVGQEGGTIWYPSKAKIAEQSVTGFLVTSRGKVLLRFPAT
ncbi:MAG TPA: zf-HC2 domain-containing protein [Streptosporangiaceae bacterium]|nr:zf-HC2 domain-containing protein [Streptosporangiaceae bacterium]